MKSPDTGAALNFLQHWEPEGPWVITAIVPDGPTETRTWMPGDEAALKKWLKGCEGLRNIYFSVNRPRGKLTKKAAKVDIKYVLALHVDCDPDKRKDLTEERARILKLLRGFDPAPSVIVDSGGGYQGFWLLDRPEPVENVAELEAYNKQLELLLGGDRCHNLDRIMRLPGTVNVPTKKKRDAGRRPAAAALISADWDRRYPLKRFTPAPTVEAPDSTVEVVISGNLPSVDVADLALDDEIKALIVHGDDPSDPERYAGDRSKVAWRVTVEMARAKLSDDVIAAVLLDPDLGISGHVRDQRRPEAYVTRQIARAREAVIDPDLERLNRDCFCVWDGNNYRVYIEREADPVTGRRSFIKATFTEFRNAYLNEEKSLGHDARGRPITVSLGKWWLTHKRRREYRGVVFAPNREVPDYYNLWRGFAVDPRPGDWSGYREHVAKNVCGGVKSHYDYVIRWMARAVQYPGCPGEVAIVLRGPKGAGKGVFARTFGGLFDAHFLAISQEVHLTGNFNAHMRDVVLLFADEAFWAGDKKGEGVLKTMITEPDLVIEAKGVDAVVAPNNLHVIMASNSDWVIPAGHEERRYMVLEVGDARRRDTKFFAAIADQMDAGGLEGLLHDLLRMDLTKFDHRTPPTSEALLEQKHLSMTPEERWWFDKLWDGIVLSNQGTWVKYLSKDDLQADYCLQFRSRGLVARAWKTSMGMFLGKVLPPGYPRTRLRTVDLHQEGGRSVRVPRGFYELPDLRACRGAFDRYMEERHAWPPEVPGRGEEPATEKLF